MGEGQRTSVLGVEWRPGESQCAEHRKHGGASVSGQGAWGHVQASGEGGLWPWQPSFIPGRWSAPTVPHALCVPSRKWVGP